MPWPDAATCKPSASPGVRRSGQRIGARPSLHATDWLRDVRLSRKVVVLRPFSHTGWPDYLWHRLDETVIEGPSVAWAGTAFLSGATHSSFLCRRGRARVFVATFYRLSCRDKLGTICRGVG